WALSASLSLVGVGPTIRVTPSEDTSMDWLVPSAVATRTRHDPVSWDLITVSLPFGTAATATDPACNNVCGSGGAAGRVQVACGVVDVVVDVAVVSTLRPHPASHAIVTHTNATVLVAVLIAPLIVSSELPCSVKVSAAAARVRASANHM